MSSRGRVLLSVLALAAALVAGQAAFATTLHPSYFGTNVSFTGIQETSTFGDPEPLFGAPSGLGDQLLFFPANFTASAAGAGGFDATGAQLQLVIDATSPGATLDTLLIDEFGDNTLLGAGGAGTSTFATMAGFVTITHTTAGPISPVVIGFNAGGGVNGSFTPAALGTGLALPGNAGVTLWSGNVAIDIASIVPNATRAVLSFDNDLYAFSEAGTIAKIQKKVVDGPAIVISVVPEPGTLALLWGGLLALTIRARGRRA